MSGFSDLQTTSTPTVITRYEHVARTSANYESEEELEREFIRILTEQGYEYLAIRKEAELKANLRLQLEKLNDYRFSDSEWVSFFKEKIANANEGIVEKTWKIQEDSIQVLTRDDGSSKNIKLIDARNVEKNSVQVIEQYESGVEQGVNKEILISIQKAVAASEELRSKKELIERFIKAVDGYADVREGWNEFVEESRENDLIQIIHEERLQEDETRKFMENAFRDGEVKTLGTALDKIMPRRSFFDEGRTEKKETIIEKLKRFFEKYFGVGRPFLAKAANGSGA